MIILKLVFNVQDRGVDWIFLAEDQNMWRFIVITVMNLVVL
jgi:hypothetical protein